MCCNSLSHACKSWEACIVRVVRRHTSMKGACSVAGTCQALRRDCTFKGYGQILWVPVPAPLNYRGDRLWKIPDSKDERGDMLGFWLVVVRQEYILYFHLTLHRSYESVSFYLYCFPSRSEHKPYSIYILEMFIKTGSVCGEINVLELMTFIGNWQSWRTSMSEGWIQEWRGKNSVGVRWEITEWRLK